MLRKLRQPSSLACTHVILLSIKWPEPTLGLHFCSGERIPLMCQSPQYGHRITSDGFIRRVRRINSAAAFVRNTGRFVEHRTMTRQ